MLCGVHLGCWACASMSVYKVVVRMPMAAAVRAMRRAISPRLAMRRDLIGTTFAGAVDDEDEDGAAAALARLRERWVRHIVCDGEKAEEEAGPEKGTRRRRCELRLRERMVVIEDLDFGVR